MKDLLLAWKNVQRNRRRSLVTILIAMVGTVSILAAGGFALYTYAALEDGAARELGHITVAQKAWFEKDEDTPLQYGIEDAASLARKLEQDPRVRRVLARISLSGLVSNGDKSMIFVGTGVNIQAEAAARGAFLKLLEGTLGNEGKNGPEVLLGSDLAKSLNAHPGSGLTLLATTSGGAMNAIDVTVSGVVSTGWREMDKRLVYMNLDTAQHLLATGKVGSLSVYLDDTDSTPGALSKLSGMDEQYAYKPWWEQAFYYHSVRALYNRIFGLLGLIIAALVFFSVANTLAMAVVERTREIGTLRALGALPGEIVGQFVREGLVIGALGAAGGTLLAVALILLLPSLGLQMPPPPGRSEGYPLLIDFSWPLTLIANGAIIGLCALAALPVSRKAAARPIVEALGHV